MADLAELIALVEGLQGPDREVDAAIAIAFSTVENMSLERQGLNGDFDEKVAFAMLFGLVEKSFECEDCGRSLDRSALFSIPDYTGSIDAAVALCERVLPEWGYQILWEPLFRHGTPKAANAALFKRGHEQFAGPNAVAHADTPAIALVLAVLRAKEADNG